MKGEKKGNVTVFRVDCKSDRVPASMARLLARISPEVLKRLVSTRPLWRPAKKGS